MDRYGNPEAADLINQDKERREEARRRDLADPTHSMSASLGTEQLADQPAPPPAAAPAPTPEAQPESAPAPATAPASTLDPETEKKYREWLKGETTRRNELWSDLNQCLKFVEDEADTPEDKEKVALYKDAINSSQFTWLDNRRAQLIANDIYDMYDAKNKGRSWLRKGWDQMQTSATSLAAGIDTMFNSDHAEQNADTMEYMRKQNPRSVAGIEDIHSVGDFFNWGIEAAGEQAPNLMLAAAGGVAGGAIVGAAGLTGTAAALTEMAAAGVVAYPMNFEENAERQVQIARETGKEYDALAAHLSAGAYSAIDSIGALWGAGRQARQIFQGTVKGMTRKAATELVARNTMREAFNTSWKKFAKDLLLDAASEGVQEVVQDLIGAAFQKKQTGHWRERNEDGTEQSIPEYLMSLANEAVAAGFTTLLFGGIGGAASTASNRSQVRTAQERVGALGRAAEQTKADIAGGKVEILDKEAADELTNFMRNEEDFKSLDPFDQLMVYRRLIAETQIGRARQLDLSSQGKVNGANARKWQEIIDETEAILSDNDAARNLVEAYKGLFVFDESGDIRKGLSEVPATDIDVLSLIPVDEERQKGYMDPATGLRILALKNKSGKTIYQLQTPRGSRIPLERNTFDNPRDVLTQARKFAKIANVIDTRNKVQRQFTENLAAQLGLDTVEGVVVFDGLQDQALPQDVRSYLIRTGNFDPRGLTVPGDTGNTIYVNINANRSAFGIMETLLHENEHKAFKDKFLKTAGLSEADLKTLQAQKAALFAYNDKMLGYDAAEDDYLMKIYKGVVNGKIKLNDALAEAKNYTNKEVRTLKDIYNAAQDMKDELAEERLVSNMAHLGVTERSIAQRFMRGVKDMAASLGLGNPTSREARNFIDELAGVTENALRGREGVAAPASAPETGTPKPETGTPKPETGTPKPETGTPKPETGTPKPETGTPAPENVEGEEAPVPKEPEAPSAPKTAEPPAESAPEAKSTEEETPKETPKETETPKEQPEEPKKDAAQDAAEWLNKKGVKIRKSSGIDASGRPVVTKDNDTVIGVLSRRILPESAPALSQQTRKELVGKLGKMGFRVNDKTSDATLLGNLLARYTEESGPATPASSSAPAATQQKPAEAQPAAAATTGKADNTFRVKTPNREMAVEGKWEAVPTDKIITSFDPRYKQFEQDMKAQRLPPGVDRQLQNRDDSGKTNEEKVKSIANDPDYDLLNDSATSGDAGAPFGIWHNGLCYIVAGNHRARGIQLSFQIKHGDGYKASATADMSRRGVKVPAGDFIAVRVLDPDSLPGQKLYDFTDASNNDGKQAKRSGEKAVNDILAVKAHISKLRPDEKLSSKGNLEFVEALMGVFNDASLRSADGEPNDEAYRRIRRALVATMLSAMNDPASRDLARIFSEKADKLELDNIINGVTAAAAPIASATEATKGSDMNFGKALADALRAIVDFRQSGGKSMKAFLSQENFDFGDKQQLSEEAGLLAQAIAENANAPRKIGELLSEVAARVEAAVSNTKQENLFDTGEKPNLAGIVRAAVDAKSGKATEAEINLLRDHAPALFDALWQGKDGSAEALAEVERQMNHVRDAKDKTSAMRPFVGEARKQAGKYWSAEHPAGGSKLGTGPVTVKGEAPATTQAETGNSAQLTTESTESAKPARKTRATKKETTNAKKTETGADEARSPGKRGGNGAEARTDAQEARGKAQGDAAAQSQGNVGQTFAPETVAGVELTADDVKAFTELGNDIMGAFSRGDDDIRLARGDVDAETVNKGNMFVDRAVAQRGVKDFRTFATLAKRFVYGNAEGERRAGVQNFLAARWSQYLMDNPDSGIEEMLPSQMRAVFNELDNERPAGTETKEQQEPVEIPETASSANERLRELEDEASAIEQKMRDGTDTEEDGKRLLQIVSDTDAIVKAWREKGAKFRYAAGNTGSSRTVRDHNWKIISVNGKAVESAKPMARSVEELEAERAARAEEEDSYNYTGEAAPANDEGGQPAPRIGKDYSGTKAYDAIEKAMGMKADEDAVHNFLNAKTFDEGMKRLARFGIEEATARAAWNEAHDIKPNSPQATENETPAHEPEPADAKHTVVGKPLVPAIASAPTSYGARLAANIEAIRIAKDLDVTGRTATEAEREKLAKFTGWGGMGHAFSFYDDRAKLQSVLTPEEMSAAELSANSAYFTPTKITTALWDIARALGFKGGSMLEGSAGVGNIISAIPQELRAKTDVHAVEIDPMTALILKGLHPQIAVDVAGFQDVNVPAGSVNLAITNVPFVTGLRVYDKANKDLSERFKDLHDFCIAKNIRALAEGGLGIFITTSNTLDKSDSLRRWITEQGNADVIGAFRLANDTFGGTNVTSDIIVVRKRVGGQKSAAAIDISSAPVERMTDYDMKPVAMYLNKYFHDHPEMMAGEMAFNFEKGETFRATSYGLFPSPEIDADARFADFVKSMEAKRQDMKAPRKETDEREQHTFKLEDKTIHEGELHVTHGEVCVARGGESVPLGGKSAQNKVTGANNKSKYTRGAVVTDYSTIKNRLHALLDAQKNPAMSDADIEKAMKALNGAYDQFVKRYGPLNLNNRIGWLDRDIFWPEMCALEEIVQDTNSSNDGYAATIYNERDGIYTHFRKSDVFKKRVIAVEKTQKPASVTDAVLLDYRNTATVSAQNVAKMLGLSTEDATAQILKSGLAFIDPATGALMIRHDYLSGNVREKLAIAQAQNTDGRFDENIKALNEVMPPTIPAHLIGYALGSTWLPKRAYTAFFEEMFDAKVKLDNMGGQWIIGLPSFVEGKNFEQGVYSGLARKRISGAEIAAAAMKGASTIQVTVTEKVGETKKIVHDKVAEATISTKIDEFRDEFKSFVQKMARDDEAIAAEIEGIYNERFNNLAKRVIDDRFLPDHFEGANQAVNLYPHQKKAVILGTTQPVMLAHEVGSGKTFTLITTAMEMRRLGTARKPMIVVQNATIGQFVASAKFLYPGARILAPSKADAGEARRQEFYAKAKFNDWDMIIVPQSMFGMIPDSEESRSQYYKEAIAEKRKVLEAISQGDDRESKRAAAQIEKEIDKLMDKLANGDDEGEGESKGKSKRKAKDLALADEKVKERAKRLLDRKVDDVETFQDMDIDALLIDEAHNYKKLGFATSLSGRNSHVKGIDTTASKKAVSTYMKIRHILNTQNGRNVVMATGTPISNTAAEIFTFMRYLMPLEVRQQYGLEYFDDFVHNFGDISQLLEFNTSGQFKENTRFAGYFNTPELVRLWQTVSDTVLAKDTDVSKALPEVESGGARDVFLPQTPTLIGTMKTIRAWLAEYEKMSGKEKKEKSYIPLVAFGLAKAAAIDVRLLDPAATDEPGSKTNKAIDLIMEDLADTEERSGTVAVFCDRNKHQTDGKIDFNLFEDMKNKLVARGIPANMIAIIESGMSDTKKLEIFDKINAGEIRVVFGSTETLGTGVNIQTRLHMAIHMDAPPRPMDYTQRNGRILRQGNLWKQWGAPVHVVRFGVEDSLDVSAYQRLKTKSEFINSVMMLSAKDQFDALASRSIEDSEEEGVFDNPVATLSGSQYALLKNKAERDLRKLNAKRESYEADQVYLKRQLESIPGGIKYHEELSAEMEAEFNRIREQFGSQGAKSVEFGGKKYGAYDMDINDGFEDFNKQLAATRKEAQGVTLGQDYHKVLNLPVKVDGVDFTVRAIVKAEKVFNSEHSLPYMKSSTEIGWLCPALDKKSLVKVDGQWPSKAVHDIVRYTTGRDVGMASASHRQQAEYLRSQEKALRARYGIPFAEEEALKVAEARVKDFEQKMKEELAAKEKKYADAQPVAGVNVDAAIAAAQDEDSDGASGLSLSRGDEDMESEGYFGNERYDAFRVNMRENMPDTSFVDEGDGVGIRFSRVEDEEERSSLEKAFAGKDGTDYILDFLAHGDGKWGTNQWKDYIKTIDWSKAGDYIRTYRAMEQLPDGSLIPPMAGYLSRNVNDVNGAAHVGDIVKSDERPDLIIQSGRDKGKFPLHKYGLKKKSGKYVVDWSTVPAAYNPYLHSSFRPLNDQFNLAWARPNLVTVEMLIPTAEFAKALPYHADKAKNAVGLHPWTSGPVTGQLHNFGKPLRQVLMSQYGKINRVLSNEDVASSIMNDFGETADKLQIPQEVFPPEVYRLLTEKYGVKGVSMADVEERRLAMENAYSDRGGISLSKGDTDTESVKSRLTLPGGKVIDAADAWQYRDGDGNLHATRWSDFLGQAVTQQLDGVLDRLMNGEEVSQAEIEATPEWSDAMIHAQLDEDKLRAKYGVTTTKDIDDSVRKPIRDEIVEAALAPVVQYQVKVKATGKKLTMNEALKPEDGKPAPEPYTVAQDRVAIIVTGLPSAGKSSVFVNSVSTFYKARVCDSDSIKAALPEFDNGYGGNVVHNESADLNEVILDRATQRGDNVIYPILGFKAPNLKKTLNELRARGYNVHILCNDLPPAKATARLIMRFLQKGRYLPLFCIYKAAGKTQPAYQEVKNEYDSHALYSNDVAFGERPRRIEASEGGILEAVPAFHGSMGEPTVLRDAGGAQGAVRDGTGENGRGAVPQVEGGSSSAAGIAGIALSRGDSDRFEVTPEEAAAIRALDIHGGKNYLVGASQVARFYTEHEYSPERLTKEQVWSESFGIDAPALVAEIVKKPRVLTPYEHAAMVRHLASYEARLDALTQKQSELEKTPGTPTETLATLDNEIAVLGGAIQTIYAAFDYAGTKAGQALAFRNLIQNAEMTAGWMLRRMKKQMENFHVDAMPEGFMDELERFARDYKQIRQDLETAQGELVRKDAEATQMNEILRNLRNRPKKDPVTRLNAIMSQTQDLVFAQGELSDYQIEKLVKKVAAEYVALDPQFRNVDTLLGAVRDFLDASGVELDDAQIREYFAGRTNIYDRNEARKLANRLQKQVAKAVALEEALQNGDVKEMRRVCRKLGIAIREGQSIVDAQNAAILAMLDDEIAELEAELGVPPEAPSLSAGERSAPAEVADSGKARLERLRALRAEIMNGAEETRDARIREYVRDSLARNHSRLQNVVGKTHENNATVPPSSTPELEEAERELRNAEREERTARQRGEKNVADQEQKRIERLRQKVADLEKQVLDAQEGFFQNDMPKMKKRRAMSAEETALVQRIAELRHAYRTLLDAQFPGEQLAEERAIRARQRAIQRSIENLQNKMEGSEQAQNETKKDFSNDPRLDGLKRQLAEKKKEYLDWEAKRKWDSMSAGGKAIKTVADFFDLTKSLVASGDLSAIWTQCGWMMLGNPRLNVRAVRDGLRSLFSGKQSEKIMDDLARKYDLKRFVEDGLEIHAVGTAAESEMFARDSNPILNKLIPPDNRIRKLGGMWLEASARGFDTPINIIRASTYAAALDACQKNGRLLGKEERQTLAQLINYATGTGDLKIFKNGLLKRILWAPGRISGQVQTIQNMVNLGLSSISSNFATQKFRNLDIDVRRNMFWQVYGKSLRNYIALTAVLYALSRLMWDDDDDDKRLVGDEFFNPLSAQFLKYNLAGNYFAPLGGMEIYLRTSARVAAHGRTDRYGRFKEFDGFQNGTALGELGTTFVMNKLSPTMQLVAAALNREAKFETLETPGQILQYVVQNTVYPLTLHDSVEAFNEHGIPTGAALTMMNLVGLSSWSYGHVKRDTAVRNFNASLKAYKEFAKNGEDAKLRALMNRYDWLKPQYRVRLTNLAGQYKKVADQNKKAAAQGRTNANLVARQAQLAEQIYVLMREAEGQ